MNDIDNNSNDLKTRSNIYKRTINNNIPLEIIENNLKIGVLQKLLNDCLSRKSINNSINLEKFINDLEKIITKKDLQFLSKFENKDINNLTEKEFIEFQTHFGQVFLAFLSRFPCGFFV